MKQLLVAMACLLVLGCQNETRPPAPAQSKTREDIFGIEQWTYVNRDESGQAVTKGTLMLPSPLKEGARFSSSWQAQYTGPIGQESKIGPQLNVGVLMGEVTDGQLILRLNPNMVDNNVTLIGKRDGERITGEWQYSTIAGVSAKGAFEATRRP